MEAFYLAKRLLSAVLVSPLGLMVLAALGFFVDGLRKPKTPRHETRRKGLLFWISFWSLCGGLSLSTNEVSKMLVATVEGYAGASIHETKQFELAHAVAKNLDTAPQAVVILGGGIRFDEREPTSPWMLHSQTAERMLYGTYLARQLKLPVLLTGGVAPPYERAEARVMADFMQRFLNYKATWLEERSRDTRENAILSAAMLKEAGIQRVLLVTHAVHMARSRIAFERAGLQVAAAPTGFQAGQGSPPVTGLLIIGQWVPNAGAAYRSWYAGHELLGLLWYRLTQSF